MPENPPQQDPDEKSEPARGPAPGGGSPGGAPPPPTGDTPPPPGAPSPPPPPPPTEPQPATRRFTRSSSDKLIGGVAGGLGRYFGVDPILFRIAFVVLTFAGGVGVLAYIGLLAFVPADDGGGLTQTRSGNLIAAVALGLLAVVLLGPPVFFAGPVLLPIALLVGIGLLLWRASGGASPAPGDPARMVARAAIAFLIGLAAIGAFIGVFMLAAFGGGVVLSVLAILAGVALLGAAFAGGARWLIVPALVLVLPLAIVAAADIDVEGGVGDHHYRPASVSELHPEYQLGMGDLVVDMRDVDLPSGRTDLHVENGIGHVLVRVPEDACVSADVEIGIGQSSILDHGRGGVDVKDDVATTAPAGAPLVHLDADVGIGHLEVRRGSDPIFRPGLFDEASEAACP
jgi:phage shock protein PspC (stress-responsive transcriptional regulator)/predicted membrane protein